MSLTDFFLLVIVGIVVLFVRLSAKTFIAIGKEHLEREEKNREAAKVKALRVIRKDIDQLAIARNQMFYKDSYGHVNDSKWKKEIDYYINTKIVNQLPEAQKTAVSAIYDELSLVIEQETKLKLRELKKGSVFDERFSGVDFELFCENQLVKCGWKVTRTKASGDQGVDLLGVKGKRKIAIQCKRYSKPVGNKAVQEVVAGKVFYGVSEGIIISNSSFTRAAHALASVNDIKLLSYLEIKKI